MTGSSQPEALPDILFVYGSLLSDIAHPQGERLRRETVLVGPATLQAKLFRVSWYPGVTLSDARRDAVQGELYRLTAATLSWLDEYEGVTTGAASVAPADEYRRQRCTVRDAAGRAHEAWVYVYQRDTTQLARVDSGRWIG